MKYIIKKDNTVSEYLLMLGYKKNTIKNLLKYNSIYLDGKVINHFNHPIYTNQVLEINKQEKAPLEIIYEDKDVIVVNKPSGLLTTYTDKEKEKTAYYIIKEYLKNKKENIYLVHRLDQYTSGILMFVKNKKLYNELTSNWNKYVLERGYIAIIEGHTKHKKGTIKNYLTESKSQEVYITSKDKGKLAITNYQEIKSNKRYTMLKLNLETGRKNQIRVHLSSIHHPIVGDKKYGSTINPIQRLALHHYSFSFKHPFTYHIYKFNSQTPKEFDELIS